MNTLNSIVKKRVLSAVQPTANLHLGNFLGALNQWVPLQDEYDCFFFAVDLHSITVRQDPKELLDNTYKALSVYLASGIDPKKSTLFVQSQVPEHAELAWILTCMSSMGELSRMTQFKDKSQKHGAHIPTGLFLYPVLMAADILLYQTHFVPVGEDQKQHLELARDLAERTNNAYPSDQGSLFQVPNPLIQKTGARVMSLQDPEKKMSKSDPTPGSCVFLFDSDKEIEKKFKRAVTDSGSEVKAEEQSSGVRNLLMIQAALLGVPYEERLKMYVGRGYGYLKVDTAEITIQKIRPIREEAEKFLENKDYLHATIQHGAQQARQIAQKTLNEVYKRFGFIRQSMS